jgi:NDP-sugar pyrophosphorylase family protein
MKAMLFAAGLGTRLKPFTDSCPKALVEVHGRSLLERNISYLQQFGIYDVIVNVHHFAGLVETAIDKRNGYGSKVTISDERDMLLETGGGLLKAASFFEGEENFVVMNVDILTSLDLGKMIATHRQGDAWGTLAVMKRESSRHFLFNEQMELCGWVNNTTGEKRMSQDADILLPFAFSGVQVLSANVFSDCPFAGKFSLVDLYLHLAKNHILKGYEHTGDIFIDVGKPDSIAKAELLFDR